jgi:uncharacterized protein YukE
MAKLQLGTIPGPKNVISDVEIAAAARAAGFPESEIPTAVAVALAESGGDTLLQNQNRNGSIDKGLWQINSSAHPEKLAGMGDWTDPQANANMAEAVWEEAGKRWRPWVSYNHNSHLQYMKRGEDAAATTRTNIQQDINAAPRADASGFDARPGDMQATAGNVNGLLSQASGILSQVQSATLSPSAFTQLGAPVAQASGAVQAQMSQTLQSILSLLQQVNSNVVRAAQLYQAFDRDAAAALDAGQARPSATVSPAGAGPAMTLDAGSTPTQVA